MFSSRQIKQANNINKRKHSSISFHFTILLPTSWPEFNIYNGWMYTDSDDIHTVVELICAWLNRRRHFIKWSLIGEYTKRTLCTWAYQLSFNCMMMSSSAWNRHLKYGAIWSVFRWFMCESWSKFNAFQFY